MPTTRKKVIKTVYKDEDDSDQGEDFSDSGSDAKISEVEESSSGEEFEQESIKIPKCTTTKRTKFAKAFINKINRQKSPNIDDSEVPEAPFISVSQLSAADKLLPSVLNLSESDSSDDDMPSTSNKSMHGKKQDVLSQHNIVNKKVKYHDSKETVHVGVPFRLETLSESENEEKAKYNDVWAKNITNNSEEIAIKTYLELEKHKNKIEEAKASILKYTTEVTYTSEVTSKNQGSNVKDLLALGEEVEPNVIKTNKKKKKIKDDSDVEGEDWEEVDDKKAIPQQGLQVTVAIPGYISRERKKIDVEMMIKRKMNRVKKEYQIYMHKVHVLCWIGHGNYVSRVLNDQEIMAAALSLVPSKECYPGERVDMKYLEQIVIWYKDKLTVKQDKNENKFKPKAPPLKEILLDQIKKKVVTSNKYLVYIFISILRALGLQCRLMLNFVTTPLKPPSSELCSLSTKPKIEKDKKQKFPPVNIPKMSIPQVDGVYDTEYELFYEEKLCNIIQLDGSNDELTVTRSTRSRRGVTAKSTEKLENKVSPPKRRKSPNIQNKKASKIENNKNSPETEDISPPKKLKTSPSPGKSLKTYENIKQPESNTSPLKSTRRKPMARTAKNPKPDDNNSVITTENNSPGENLVKGQSHSSKLSLRKSSRGVQTFPAENLDIDKVTNIDKVIEKSCKTDGKKQNKSDIEKLKKNEIVVKSSSKIDSNNQQNTRRTNKSVNGTDQAKVSVNSKDKNKISDDQVTAPKIMINNEEMDSNISKYFKEEPKSESLQKTVQCRKRSHTANPKTLTITSETGTPKTKTRTKSDPGTAVEKSKYFKDSNVDKNTPVPKKPRVARQTKVQEDLEDKLRVSHRELGKAKPKAKNDVTGDLVNIIKKSVKEAKEKSKRGKVKGKHVESDEDSDYLPIQSPIHIDSGSDDFKPTKKSPKPSTSRKIDRRVLSSDQEQLPKNKMDVWCEIFVEELEQWVAIDVLKAKVHCTTDIYNRATHPVCYVVSWDNCNYLKDLTRRYVPHWNTVTRKQRAEPAWWNTAIAPWLGPKTARDREEDEALDRMQLEAPLPKSISEYKNHPLYALKRHLLKFEAIYPPEAATLGFVRGEAVYARDCVYVCRSRDVWLKEAKVVRLGEKPYKIVKARPKWDKLSNKMITDKPLEIFGPWQTQDYEPPVAENGVVPRNAYGNVELFKPCMLPKGTVHIKLPCLNRVAKKLNIDCAPAMTGFDFNGGWSHPVYDGFVVCQEYEELITEAWVKDQEEQERREREKIDSRVYGNWKRLIKGLLIRERLRDKYGFVTPEPEEKKNKGPRFVTKKKK